jgi:hypothetical protein
MTALATCPDLTSQKWTVLKDPKFGKINVWDIVPVLPTTEKRWMNSQSSYHAIQRLADGQWLAFMRGTSVDQIVQLGFATSDDGRKWNYLPENPVIHPNDGGGGLKGVYRPCFVGYLGKNKAGKREYLIVWSESPAEADVPKVMYGYTTDFITIQRDPRGYARWEVASDGPISPWREGNRLYLFLGKYVQVIVLPVSTRSVSTIETSSWIIRNGSASLSRPPSLIPPVLDISLAGNGTTVAMLAANATRKSRLTSSDNDCGCPGVE